MPFAYAARVLTILSAGNNTHLNFTVILNPCSGPCLNSSPETPYQIEVPKLSQYSNIKTLGYVATNYTNKPLETLMQEIHTYANWTQMMGEKVALDGIFFDETPGTYDWRWYDYLKLAGEEVKKQKSLGERIVGTVIFHRIPNTTTTNAASVHNPGNLPYVTWNYLNLTDITVVFEETFTKFIDTRTFNALKSLETTYGLPKSAFAIMLHSIPNIPDELVDWLADQMKHMTGYNFVSSVGTPGEYWHSFSSIFNHWVWVYANR